MHESRNLTVIGFDFGFRRIGIAIGQTVTHTARPLTVINAKSGTPTDWHIVDKVIAEWLPDIFVVGLPLNMDDTEQALVPSVKQFAEQLAERYKKPVELFDERLSTKEARQRVFDESGFRGLQKKRVDDIAAQIILESWLAERGRA